MSYDQNSSGNNGGTPSPPPTPPPLSWYAAISSMALGALGRGSGRDVHPVPVDRSNTNTNTNIISHSDSLTLPSENESGASSRSFAGTTNTATANSTSAGTAGRPRSIPISFLINHTPEPHLSPRIPEYPSFSASSSSLSSPSLSSMAEAEEWAFSSSTASSESPSLTPAQIRRSPRSLSAATLSLGGASTPTSLATIAGASASYYRRRVRGSVQRLSQSYHHFSPQSALGRSSNSNSNNSGSDSNSSALLSASTQAVNAEQIDAPVFSTTHHARSRSTHSDRGGKALSRHSLSRNDNNVQNSYYDSRVSTTGRSAKDDTDNNNSGDNSNNNNDNDINNNHSAVIMSESRSSGQAENQQSLVNAAQRTRSVSSPFEEDRLLEERRVWRSPSTAPSVKARALFSAGKGASSDGDYSHRAIKSEQESLPSSILSSEAPEFCGPSCSPAAVATESSSPAGGSKPRPKPKRTKTGKILQKPKKITANNRRTAYTRFLQQQSRNLAERLPHLSAQERMKIIVEEWKVSDKNAHTTRRHRVEPAQSSQRGSQSSSESQSIASTSTSTAMASSGSGTDLNQGSSSTMTHEHAPSMPPSGMRNRFLRTSRRNNPSPAPNPRVDQKEEETPQPQQQRPDDVHRDVEE